MGVVVNQQGYVYDNGERVFSPNNLPDWSQIANRPNFLQDGSSATSIAASTATINNNGKLVFAGAGNITFQRSADSVTTDGRFVVVSDSDKAIKTTGGIFAGRNIAAYSDRKLKQNIRPIKSAMRDLKRLRGYTYQWKSDPTSECLGVIAQEVSKVFPQLVRDDDGTLAVEYTGLIPVLIEAIKSLDARLTAIEKQSA